MINQHTSGSNQLDDSTWDAIKKAFADIQNASPNSTSVPIQNGTMWVQPYGACPSCGYCPHCGRSGNGYYSRLWNEPYITYTTSIGTL